MIDSPFKSFAKKDISWDSSFSNTHTTSSDYFVYFIILPFYVANLTCFLIPHFCFLSHLHNREGLLFSWSCPELQVLSRCGDTHEPPEDPFYVTMSC